MDAVGTRPGGSSTAAAGSQVPAGPVRAAGRGRFLEFLRAELAPTPGRARAAARTTVACVIGALLVMTLQLQTGAWVIISILVLSLPNAGATLQKARDRMVGTLVACGAGLLVAAAVTDLAWLRLPVGALAGGLAIFLSRTTTRPYSALLAGITFCLFLLGAGDTPQAIVGFGLWRTLNVTLGVVIVVSVNLLVLPSDPEEELLDDLSRRLAAIEGALARLLGRGSGGGVAAAPESLLLGLPRELDLLANAETLHATLRHRHAEQMILITGVERLLTATIALDRELSAPGAGQGAVEFAGRIEAVLQGVGEARRCLERRTEGARPDPPSGSGAGAEREIAVARNTKLAATPLLPSVLEMEDSARLVARSLHLLDRYAGSPTGEEALPSSPLDAPVAGWRTPSCSLSNVADLRLGMKAALSMLLFALLMQGFAWPGLESGLVTVLVISGSTNGAIAHKAMLRVGGGAFGGVLGVAAIVTMMPNGTSLPVYILVTGACLAVAAWITAGSPRISYVGVQTGIAVALCLVDSLGPTVDLVPPRDRVVGVLLADVLTTFVCYVLWPVFATDAMRDSIVAAVRALANLARVGAHLDGQAQVAPARGYRWEFYQAVQQALVMHDEAAFEAGASSPAAAARRAAVERLLPLVQEVFLLVMAIVRHRLTVDLSRLPATAELRACTAAVADALDVLAGRLAGGPWPGTPTPIVRQRLAEARASVRAHRAEALATSDGRALLAHAEARLDLQETLAGLVERLDRRIDESVPLLPT